MDVYDKMAEFIVKNHLDNCDMCKAVEMCEDNSCCNDGDSWCIKGIASYLRDKKVLETEENKNVSNLLVTAEEVGTGKRLTGCLRL